MEDTSYDCQSCGACCVSIGPFDGDAHVYLDREEAVRMRQLGLKVVEGVFGTRCLGAAPHDGAWGHPACVAFEGEVGGGCGYFVYDGHLPGLRAR